MSINTGVFLSSWKIAKITPVYKSGSVNEIENHRPVSILSDVSKVMEKKFVNNFRFNRRKQADLRFPVWF